MAGENLEEQQQFDVQGFTTILESGLHTSDFSKIQKSLEQRETNNEPLMKEHPNNIKLKSENPIKYKENLAALEAYGDSIRSLMPWDTSFIFLNEQTTDDDTSALKALSGENLLTEFDISNLEVAKRVMDLIFNILKEYNNVFKSNINIKKLFLTTWDNESFGGYQHGNIGENNQSVLINISDYNDLGSIETVIHHELFHLLESGDYTDEENRTKLGSIDFDAYKGAEKLYGSTNMYGNINTLESKATLASMLMIDTKGTLKAARDDRTGSLKKKIEVITGCKISTKGYCFEETYTVKNYKYSKLGFLPNSYYLGLSEGRMNHDRWNKKLGYTENTTRQYGEEIEINHDKYYSRLNELYNKLDTNTKLVSYDEIATLFNEIINFSSEIKGKNINFNILVSQEVDFGIKDCLSFIFETLSSTSFSSLKKAKNNSEVYPNKSILLQYLHDSKTKKNYNNDTFFTLLDGFKSKAEWFELVERAKNITTNSKSDSRLTLSQDFITFCENANPHLSDREIRSFCKELDKTGLTILRSEIALQRKSNTWYVTIMKTFRGF